MSHPNLPGQEIRVAESAVAIHAHSGWFLMDGPPDLDPRWHWIATQDLGRVGPDYVRGPCRHTEIIPVDSIVTGETLARLCVTCDMQLPA